MEACGKKKWFIPDCFYPDKSTCAVSHEAVCVMNTSGADAEITLTLLFEDRAPLEKKSVCPSLRTHHIRLDRLGVPCGVPYAIALLSTAPVVAQYSRMDTSCGTMALMTTLAYCED